MSQSLFPIADAGIYVFIAFISFFMILVVWAIVEDRKRRRALIDLAERRGLNYIEKGADAMIDEVKMFRLFENKAVHSISHVIVGNVGDANLLFFDYTIHNPGGGKNNSYQQGSVILVSSDYLNLPTFYLRAETFLDRFNILPGSAADINIDSEPEFSGKYVLNSDDPEKTISALNRNVIKLLLEHWPLSIEASGDRFIVSGMMQVTRHKIERFFDDAIALHNHFLDAAH
ncbi:MAG: hypothetical protein ABIH86_00015 [Planctomycetota bacterium]